MSMCIIFAFLANSELLLITLSLNLAPIAITKSELESAKLLSLLPCIPTIPRDSSFFLSIFPSPISVFSTGVSILVANFSRISSLSEDLTPPPAYIIGFLDSFMISIASFKSLILVSLSRSKSLL